MVKPAPEEKNERTSLTSAGETTAKVQSAHRNKSILKPERLSHLV
jgi:hypothetical protein